jgi:hypothetical protein
MGVAEKSNLDFGEYSLLIQARIETIYGIRIVTRDIPDPLTGDLNGTEIHIDHAVTAEQRLFLLGHLFGHTVQWNSDPAAYDLGQPRQAPVDEALIPALMDYEIVAGQYALRLFHDAAVTALDQWLADYTACDRAYLGHYYRTGHRRRFQSFWQDGTASIVPIDIPAFQLIQRAFRTDGVVI